MAKEFAKKLLLSFLVGAGYLISVVAITAIMVQATGIELVDSLANLAQGLGEGSGIAIVVALFSLLITGGLIVVWVKIRPRIAKLLGLTVKEHPISTQKKLGFFLTLIIVGAITSGIFMAYAEFTANLVAEQNVNTLNAFSVGLTSGNPMLIIISFLAIAFFGILVHILGGWVNPIENALPDKINK